MMLVALQIFHARMRLAWWSAIHAVRRRRETRAWKRSFDALLKKVRAEQKLIRLQSKISESESDNA